MNGHVLIDFDETLARHNPREGLTMGEPIERTVTLVKKLLARGVEVRIFTARASVPELIPDVSDWCLKIIGQRLPVTNQKDFQTIAIIDDRAIHVLPGKGLCCCSHGNNMINRLLGL